MAFDADLEKLKAVVPAQYRPASDAAGKLSHVFSVDSGAESTALQGNENLTRHNLGMAFLNGDPDSAGPNFMLTGSQATIRDAMVERIRHTRDQDGVMSFALRQAREALEARLAALDAEIARIDAKLRDINERRSKIGEELDALHDLDARLAKGELDPDDPRDAALCRRAGIDPETLRGKDAAEQAEIILRRRTALAREDGGLEWEERTLLDRRGVVVKRRAAVDDALKDLSLADTPEAQALALQRAQSVDGVRSLGGAAFVSDRDDVRTRAADAVADNEEVALRADSKAYARAASTQTDDFFKGSDNMDWDRPPGGAPAKPPSPS